MGSVRKYVCFVYVHAKDILLYIAFKDMYNTLKDLFYMSNTFQDMQRPSRMCNTCRAFKKDMCIIPLRMCNTFAIPLRICNALQGCVIHASRICIVAFSVSYIMLISGNLYMTFFIHAAIEFLVLSTDALAPAALRPLADVISSV